MKQNKYRVHCALSDCYYYLAEKHEDAFGESSQLIYCTYPERDLTSDDRPCPYYRMDWKKKMKLVQEKIQANKAARAKAQPASPSSSAAVNPVPASPPQGADAPAETQKIELPSITPSPGQPEPEQQETSLPLPDTLFNPPAQNDHASNGPGLAGKESKSKTDSITPTVSETKSPGDKTPLS